MGGVDETMEPFPFDDLVDYVGADAGDFETYTADNVYCNPNDGKQEAIAESLPHSRAARLTISVSPNVNDIALPPSMAATTPASYQNAPPGDSRSYVNAIDWQDPFQGFQNYSVPESYAPPQRQMLQDSNSDKCCEDHVQDIGWPWLTHGTNADSFNSLRESGSTLPQPACEATNIEDESVQVSQTKQKRCRDRSHKSSLESVRARNRVAASKCRAKQKNRIKALHETFEKVSSRNAYLKHQTQQLRRSVVSLKDFALQHHSARCCCTTLHSFNKMGAKRVFRTLSSPESSSP